MNNQLLTRIVLKVALAFAIFAGLYLARPFLMTFSISGLLAMLFDPLHSRIERIGIGRLWATTACMAILVSCFLLIGILLGGQIANFIEKWPSFKQEAIAKFEELRDQVEEQLGWDASGDPAPAGDAPDESPSRSLSPTLNTLDSAQVTEVFNRIYGVVGEFLLMFVYFVFLLSEKYRLRAFVIRRFAPENRTEVEHTIDRVLAVAQKYLQGRLFLMLLLGVIYCLCFSLIGIRNGLFIGVLAALLSIIPYIGNILGGALAVGLALLSGSDLSQALWIIGIMSAAQVVENYILDPLVLGHSVSINPLATVIILIVFLILWGPIGAIVSIPILGIARIVFNQIPGMADYGFLVGEEAVVKDA